MLIDSHCHLEYEGLAEDQDGVLERARAAGIGGFVNISTRQSEWARVVGTAEREPDVWATIGIHPHEADRHADLGEAALLEAAGHPRVVGIGETGLDYYYDRSDRQVQQALFRTHIGVARKGSLDLLGRKVEHRKGPVGDYISGRSHQEGGGRDGQKCAP